MIRTDSSSLEERVARMRELLARDGADEVVWFGLGQTLLALGRPAEAVDPLREAVRLRPDYSAAHRDLGRALLEAGRSEEAVRALERAAQVAESTRDLQTGREIAVLLRKAAKPPRSEPKASEGGPPQDGAAKPQASGGGPPRDQAVGPGEDPGVGAGSAAGGAATAASIAALQLAREALRQLANDRLERAIALYERALETDPRLALAWNGLSVAWRLRGDLDRAIEAARRLAELEPDDPLSHTNLSILYQTKGMIPEAEDEKAIAMRLQLRSRR